MFKGFARNVTFDKKFLEMPAYLAFINEFVLIFISENIIIFLRIFKIIYPA